MLFTVLGPQVLRHGVRLIATPWNTAEPVSLFSIAVDPGNATVAKGGDELIEAQLRGFQSDRVELLVRSADSANWTRLPMTADSTGKLRVPPVRHRRQDAVRRRGERRAVDRRTRSTSRICRT